MSTAELEALKRENAELKAANSELKDRLELMETIFNIHSEGVAASNLEGEFIIVNSVAQEIVGVETVDTSPDEWSGRYGVFYTDKVTPVPTSELPLYKALSGMATDNVEMFIRNSKRPEGVFINISGRPLFNKEGNVTGGVIVMRDITELKAVEAELESTINDLQAQTQLMEIIFDNISDGVVVANADGEYTLFNAVAKHMAGYNPVGVKIPHASETFGLFLPDGESLFPTSELPLAKALEGEQTDNVEMLLRNVSNPNGLYVSVSGRPISNEQGVMTGGVSTIRNISKEKEAEAQLRTLNDQLTDQSELMESIFNSMSDGVIVADEIGHITFFNPSAKRIARIDLSPEDIDEWPGRYEFFHIDGVTPISFEELPLMQAIQGRATYNIEAFLRNSNFPDGFYVNISGNPLRDSAGTQKGGVIVFQDITERIRSREAMAEAFSQGRLEIIDTILHNIGNAINSVAVGVETIYDNLKHDKLVPRLSALARAIEKNRDNLNDYIKNDPQGQQVLPFILTLSHDFTVLLQELQETTERIRSRTAHIVDIVRTQKSYHSASPLRKDIELAVAISDAVKILQDSIDKRQIEVGIDCEKAPVEIRIQESQFHQMLVNFIKNAIEAIDDLALLDKPFQPPRIECHAYSKEEFLYIDITDNGIGIMPEDAERIFTAGFTTKDHGSGLGLHSSANFVISSGGQIEALSEGKGKGTTMRIMLPRALIQAGSSENSGGGAK